MTDRCVACGCEIDGRHLVGMRSGGPLPITCTSRCAALYDDVAKEQAHIPAVEKWVLRSASLSPGFYPASAHVSR